MEFLKKPGTIISIIIVIGLVVMAVSSPSVKMSEDDIDYTIEPVEDITINEQETTMTQENQNGLITEILKEGSGDLAVAGKNVSVHYTGTLVDGTVFDSSVERGQPFSFLLGGGQVIAGWDQGVAGMKVGEKRRLTIPSDLAYGNGGIPGVIPGGATLVFEVELLAVN